MELLPCPDCGGSSFLLSPDGRIICTDDDCYAVFGVWSKEEPGMGPGGMILDPVAFDRRTADLRARGFTHEADSRDRYAHGAH